MHVPLHQALNHLPGIGPRRLTRLAEAALDNWPALLAADDPLRLGPVRWKRVRDVVAAGLAAAASDDPMPLTRALATRDHWRILHHWIDAASYFDIETSGLGVASEVTVVVCLHRGELLRFVAGENLDDFLALLDDVKLMVSFNGTGFDVPRIQDLFHITEFPCPHVDLRWMCFHQGWRGGLKQIERGRGLPRPADLHGVDGCLAVWFWELWQREGNVSARRLLERYCAADTVALKLLAHDLLTARGLPVAPPSPEALWRMVDAVCPSGPGDADLLCHALRAPAAPATPAPRPAASWDGPTLGIEAATRLASSLGATREEKQRRLREKWRAIRETGRW